MRTEVETGSAVRHGAEQSVATGFVAVEALPLAMLRMARKGFCVVEANSAARTLLSMPVQDMTSWLERALVPDALTRLIEASLAGEPFGEEQVSVILGSRQVTLRMTGIASGPVLAQQDEFIWVSLEEVTTAAQVERSRQQYDTFVESVLNAWPHPGWVLDGDDRSVFENKGHFANAPACQRAVGGDPACEARRAESGTCGRLDGLSSSSKGWRAMVERVRDSGTLEEKTFELGSCGSWQVIAFPAPTQTLHGERPSQHPANQRVAILAHNLRETLSDKSGHEEASVEAGLSSAADTDLLTIVLEQERASITREIHDSLGQEVTLLKVGLERLLSQVREQALDSLLPRVMAIETLAQNLMRALRSLIMYMRSDGVGERGLAPVAIEYIVKFRRNTGMLGQLEVAEGWVEPSADHAHQLYRSLQEMLNNVVKHARASRFAARLGCNSDGVWLEVEDDGLGVPGSALRTGGLRSLQERATVYKGKVNVLTRPTITGTRVRINLPYPGSARSVQTRWPADVVRAAV
jgi:signal transduction histidine kinase